MWHRYAFSKFVRSFVLEKEGKKNKTIVSYKILNEKDYKQELFNKFHEEALEVITANNKKELIEEIADCYEVIDEILKMNNISTEEVLNAQIAKRVEKGGFEKRIFVNSVQYDDQNPLHKNAFEYVKDVDKAEKYRLLGRYHKHIIDFIISNDKTDKIYI